MENSATKSAMLDAAPSRVGTWASWVADHGKGLGLGLLVGGAVAVGLVLVVGLVVAGPVLGVIALGAIAAGALYGLITGAARFNVVDAVVQSLIGGVSAGVGFGLGAGAFLAGRALTVARAGLTVLTGGFASLGSYLVQTPHPTGHGAGAAFGWGAATAGVFLGLGALAGKFQGAIRPALGRLPGLLRFGSGPPGMSSTVYREVAVTVESDLAAAEPGATKSVASVLERVETAPAGATPQAGGKANPAAPLMGTHREIRAADGQFGMSLSLGQKLLLLREQTGVEQQEAAARIGITAAWLSQLEKKNKPHNLRHLRGTLERAATYYGVILDYLMAETPQEYMQAFIKHVAADAPTALTDRLRLVLGELHLRWGEEFTPPSVAGRLGITPERLADYVDGKEPITPEIVEQMSRLTGVPSAWFLAEADAGQSDPRPEMQELVEYALQKGLEPQELRLLIDALLFSKSKRPSGG